MQFDFEISRVASTLEKLILYNLLVVVVVGTAILQDKENVRL